MLLQDFIVDLQQQQQHNNLKYTMKTETYNKIAKKFTCDESTKQLIGFKGVLRNFEIDFYALPENNYKLQIYAFGYKSKNGWTSIEPSGAQLKDMQKRINSEVASLEFLN